MTYQALQIHKDDAGYRCTLQTLDDSALPEGDVTVQVDYSTLNYKDGAQRAQGAWLHHRG
jgi:acrylyl-CoA reductase (NADPH)